MSSECGSAPAILRAALWFEAVRRFAFRTISQINLNYRASPLSRGRAGEVHGGDRMPWVAVDGVDNHRELAKTVWQAQVYGVARPELAAWCSAKSLPLTTFPWSKRYAEAGLAENALYLVRPDTYVGLADEAGSVEALGAYWSVVAR